MNKQYLKVVVGIVVVILLAVGMLVVLAYYTSINSPIVNTFTRMMPAVVVGSDFITKGEISRNVAAARKFYESQDFAAEGVRIDFSTDDGQKRLKIIEKEVMNNLIENVVIADLLDERNESIDEDDVSMALARTIREGGDPDLARDRASLYGWSLDEFADHVIAKSIAQERLQKIFQEQNPVSQEMWDDMNLARKKLEDGRDFADVALEHSTGPSAQNGGIQGTYAFDQLDPLVAPLVFALSDDVPSDVIESEIGLHIFQIADRGTESGGVEVVTIKHIFQPKRSFEEYLNDEVAKSDVRVLLRDYKWDSETNFVEFDNLKLQAYEQEVILEIQQSLLGNLKEKQQELLELQQTEDDLSKEEIAQ